MKKILYFMVMLCMLLCLPVKVDASEWGVPVGGLQILKTNVKGEPLAGAAFQIARELQSGELTDKNVEKQFLWIGNENRIMALESFWAERTMSGDRQSEVITDGSGKAEIYGLPYGTYYLIERQAPIGYNRISEPIRVTVHKYSHLTQVDGIKDDNGDIIDNTLHIINVRYTLPDTGNWGVLHLTAAGIGIIFSSVALILLNYRRWH